MYIFFLSIVFGIFSMILYSWRFQNEMFVVKGYQLHHIWYGIIFLIFALLSYLYTNLVKLQLILLGLGIGILIEHIFNEGLVFVDKAPKYKNKIGIVKK